jgi:hypothetical protein
MFIRGSNPIWLVADLTGHLLDDSYYMFVLENEIPYIPATVYHNPDTTTTPWTNPINFLANGTLPVDIFWDAGPSDNPNVYRIEIRQGDTQSDPLIYLIENYIPGQGGGAQPTDIGFTTDNQITNPQFSILNFVSPYSITSSANIDVQVGPGWVLSLTTSGTGTAVLTKVALNDASENSSNAPYALRLTLSGWSNAVLKQRFNQNGMLWANQYVSSTITAQSPDAGAVLSAQMVDSEGNLLGQVLDFMTPIGSSFEEYSGQAHFPATINPDLPPDAWIEYQLQLQNNVDIYITSIQLIVSNFALSAPPFEQDSIERQIDHTFHYYEPQLAFKPIPSILSGWDFTENPAQFGAVQTITNSATPAYIWDQTICKSIVGNINVSKNITAKGITLTTTQANESFYLAQYLEGPDAVKAKLSNLSLNIDGYSVSQSNVTVNISLFMAKTGGTIPLLSSGLIGTLNADGTFTLTNSGWEPIPLIKGYSSSNLLNTSGRNDISFSGFDGDALYASSTTEPYFCIVVSFLVPTVSTTLYFNSISLVNGDIPTRPAPLNFAQTLLSLQKYYETTFAPGSLTSNPLLIPQIFSVVGTATNGFVSSFELRFMVKSRSASPIMTYYGGISATVNIVDFVMNQRNSTAVSYSAPVDAPDKSATSQKWTTTLSNVYGLTIRAIYLPIMHSFPTNAPYETYIYFDYEKDARLGIV